MASHEMHETPGAHMQIEPNMETGEVVYMGFDPDTGDEVFVVAVNPDVAREIAYRSTLASIKIEEARKP